MRYTYKFTDNGFDYFRDNSTGQVVKLPENTPRSDNYMTANAINAEQDEATFLFYS